MNGVVIRLLATPGSNNFKRRHILCICNVLAELKCSLIKRREQKEEMTRLLFIYRFLSLIKTLLMLHCHHADSGYTKL